MLLYLPSIDSMSSQTGESKDDSKGTSGNWKEMAFLRIKNLIYTVDFLSNFVIAKSHPSLIGALAYQVDK